jgi:hypothetical protein
MNGLTWGDSVKITDDAPADYRPGELGSIVAISDSSHGSQFLDGVYYTVEFGDGSDATLSEKFVEAAA